jgi:voltage-gated potassium channel
MDTTTEHAPGRARTPEDAAALARFDGLIAVPLVLSAILPLILLPSGGHSVIAMVVEIVTWLVFLVDFTVHERRLVHYLHTWLGRFDLSVVILTAPWFLLVGPNESKFVLLIRLARIARLVMAGKGARRLVERLGRVVIIAGSVLVVCSAVAYRAEHATNPGFATFGDALWWGIVTLTTVGYGDIVPKTSAGRFSGVIIMITGIAVLGVLAGSLASFFRLSPTESGSESPPGDDTSTTHVQELTLVVARLADQVAELTRQVGGTSSP